MRIQRLTTFLAHDRAFSTTTLPFLASVAMRIQVLFPQVRFLFPVWGAGYELCWHSAADWRLTYYCSLRANVAIGTEAHDEVEAVDSFATNSSTLLDGCEFLRNNSSKPAEAVARLG